MIRDFAFTEFWVIASGLWATLQLSAIAFLGGGLAGLGVALARTAPVKALRVAAGVFIDFFQGTPMLLQLFLVFYGLPVFGFKVNVWVAAAVGLTLHAGAFLGEIWRGGIQAVPRGQSEAADALGLSYWTRMRHIVLPQALRVTIAPTMSHFIGAVKDTSLVAIVNVYDLTGTLRLAMGDPQWQPFFVEMYAMVGAVYLLIGLSIAQYGRWLDRRHAMR